MSQKKLKRERAAKLHFDWHLQHKSWGRLLIAIPISLLFWGAVLAYLQIEKIEPTPLPERSTELEFINLDSPENARLSMLIDRESLFVNRWDVRDKDALESFIEGTLDKISHRPYQVQLQKIATLPALSTVNGLPGFRPDKLPPPQPVEILPRNRPTPEWWINVTKTSGLGSWNGLSFRWEGAPLELSDGETWTYQVGVDWRGRIFSILPLKGLRDSVSKEIHETLSISTFPRIAEDAPLRWWFLEASATDRSIK